MTCQKIVLGQSYQIFSAIIKHLMIKAVYISFLAIVLISLLSFLSYAFNAEVQPEAVIPGDVFLLTVAADKNPSSPRSFPLAELFGKKIDFSFDADNHFIALVPVDIETPPKDYSITIRFEGLKKTVRIRVKKHTFLTQRLTLPEEKVILSPENLRRAERETELLTNILSQRSQRGWNGRFTAPTDTEVSEVFGVKRIMNGKKTSIHKGMDYRGRLGTPVRALNSGTVVLRDDLFFGGNTLIIDHGMGLYSIYMHLSEFQVADDEKVSKGQTIGLVGMSGRATGPHLHLGVKLDGVSVNPEALFKLKL
jgi:murein DD-endopeptidase MepM/ murein hydrolase activator NlpD